MQLCLAWAITARLYRLEGLIHALKITLVQAAGLVRGVMRSGLPPEGCA